MAFPQHVWQQLKNTTADDLVAALKRDGFLRESQKSGAVLGFYRSLPAKRITIHYHPGKTYGAKLLTAMINSLGWTETDLRRLRLIK